MESTAESFSPINLPRQCAPRVVAITGGREGLGTSCIVVNLGVALTGMGKKVLILDADLNQARIAHLLGLKPRYTITDILSGQKSLGDVIMPGPEGLQVIPGSSGREEYDELSQAQKLLFLEELDACTEELDFILVDTGAGVSSNVLYFNVGAQEHIVVADQEPASVIDAYTFIKILGTRYSEKRFKLLFNQINRPEESHRSFEQVTKVADRFLRGSVSLEFLGFIPEDESLPQSVSVQKVMVQVNPLSPASLAFVEVARSLISQEPYIAMNGNLKFFWQSLNRRAADSFSQGDSHVSKLC